mgnify:FL=1
MSKFCVVGVEIRRVWVYCDGRGVRLESHPFQMAPRVCGSLKEATSLADFLDLNRHSYTEYGIDDLKDFVVYEVGDDCIGCWGTITTDLMMAKAIKRYDIIL